MGYYHPQLVTIFTKATRLASAQRPVGDAKGRLDIFWEILVTWKGRFARVSMELAVARKVVNLSGWHVTWGRELVHLMYSRALGIKIILDQHRTKNDSILMPRSCATSDSHGSLWLMISTFVGVDGPLFRKWSELDWLFMLMPARPRKCQCFMKLVLLVCPTFRRENFWDPNWWLRKILPDGFGKWWLSRMSSDFTNTTFSTCTGSGLRLHIIRATGR